MTERSLQPNTVPWPTARDAQRGEEDKVTVFDPVIVFLQDQKADQAAEGMCVNKEKVATRPPPHTQHAHVTISTCPYCPYTSAIWAQEINHMTLSVISL